MNRLSEAWFRFKGISSSDLGIMMTEMPQRSVAPRNVARKKVSGRNGRVWHSDGSYDDITLTLKFDARDESKLNQIDAWLTGKGVLQFSDDVTADTPPVALCYEACIEAAPTRQSIRPRFGGQRYAVKFVCAPFKEPVTLGTNETVSTSGGTFNNKGTAPAATRVKIAGSGDFNVTIGIGASAQMMQFEGVTGGGIIVDSELGDVLCFDEAAPLLENNKATGDLFVIQPGVNTVTWQTTSAGSSVESVEIVPKWRYF